MDQQCYCAGRLSGTPGEPQVTVAPAARMGWIATAEDGSGNRISLWGQTEQDARMRVLAIWHGIV